MASYVINEIIRVMDEMEKAYSNLPSNREFAEKMPLDRGFEVSGLGASQPSEVAMSPLMKNALYRFGDLQEGERLMVEDPETKAEKWIHQAIETILTKTAGPKRLEYDETIPLRSIEHYHVQCWRAVKDNMRDIQPGQAKQRQEMVRLYSSPPPDKDIRKLLLKDKDFQRAVEVVFSYFPEVVADPKFREINLPFMTKHTNVGPPYWYNDRAIDKVTGLSYAELSMRLAEGTPLHKLYLYNVSTLFGRNQKGKGRMLVATSRVVNLHLNRLEAREIAAYKRGNPYFIGYNDDEYLKDRMIHMLTYAEQHHLHMRNTDQLKYDSHVTKGLWLLAQAIRYIKAQGRLSKDLAMQRAILGLRTLLVDGLSDELVEIFGRIFSGYIDTNAGGGTVQQSPMTCELMRQDKHYSKIIRDVIWYMVTLGDDNLYVYDPAHFNYEEFKKGLWTRFNLEVNKEKDEFGPMFLQYRVFEDPSIHELVMAYAWPRVYRSMLMKETKKGLGPAGWYIAWLQQMFKCIQYKPSFVILVNLAIIFDENHFFMDKTIGEIVEMMRQEDAEKLAKARTRAQKDRVESTADKLFDGDPQKDRFLKSLEEGGKGLLEQLHEAVKSAYDPDFLQKYGLSIPS